MALAGITNKMKGVQLLVLLALVLVLLVLLLALVWAWLLPFL